MAKVIWVLVIIIILLAALQYVSDNNSKIWSNLWWFVGD